MMRTDAQLQNPASIFLFSMFKKPSSPNGAAHHPRQQPGDCRTRLREQAKKAKPNKQPSLFCLLPQAGLFFATGLHPWLGYIAPAGLGAIKDQFYGKKDIFNTSPNRIFTSYKSFLFKNTHRLT